MGPDMDREVTFVQGVALDGLGHEIANLLSCQDFSRGSLPDRLTRATDLSERRDPGGQYQQEDCREPASKSGRFGLATTKDISLVSRGGQIFDKI